MSKRPTDHLEPAAKKRGNERQLTKDDPSSDDEVGCALHVAQSHRIAQLSEQTTWFGQEPVQAEGFAKASEEVMKKRRIVRPKRAGGLSSSQTTSGAANPFAGVSLAGPSSNPFAGVNLAAAPQTNPFAQVTLTKTV